MSRCLKPGKSAWAGSKGGKTSKTFPSCQHTVIQNQVYDSCEETLSESSDEQDRPPPSIGSLSPWDNELDIDVDADKVHLRILQLKRAGLWSDNRMSKLAEPPLKKAPWDYTLMEMVKMAECFKDRRYQKEFAAQMILDELTMRKRHVAIKRYLIEKNDLVKKARKIAEMVTEFWLRQYERKKMEIEKNSLVVPIWNTSLTENFPNLAVEDFSTDEDEPANDSEIGNGKPQNRNKETMWYGEIIKVLNGYTGPIGDNSGDFAWLRCTPTYLERKLRPQKDCEIVSHSSEISRTRDSDEESDSEGSNAEENQTDSSNGYHSEEFSDGDSDFDFWDEGDPNYTERLESALNLDTSVGIPVPAVPCLLRGTLRNYQLTGLHWLASLYFKNQNGILADEAGLEKTVQIIAFVAHLAVAEKNWGPHLIVVPTSLLDNWKLNFMTWCPGLKLLVYSGSKQERKTKREEFNKYNSFHVCITSYEIFIEDQKNLRGILWKYLILDDADNIKNFKPEQPFTPFRFCLNFPTLRRLLLTRSPLPKDVTELWSLINFLMYDDFESYLKLKEWHSNPPKNLSKETIIRKLHLILSPFFLRRLKWDVEKELPKWLHHVVLCPLSSHQRYLYDNCMEQARANDAIKNRNFLEVIRVMMKLRKICNHADYFESLQPKSSFQDLGISCAMPLQVWNLTNTNKVICDGLSMFKTTTSDYRGNGKSDKKDQSYMEEILGKTKQDVLLTKTKRIQLTRPTTPSPPIHVLTEQLHKVFLIQKKPSKITGTNGTKKNNKPEQQSSTSQQSTPRIVNQSSNSNKDNSSTISAPGVKNENVFTQTKSLPFSEVEERSLKSRQDLGLTINSLKKDGVYGAGTIRICDVLRDFPVMRYFGRRRCRLGFPRKERPCSDYDYDRQGYFNIGYSTVQLTMFLKVCSESWIRNHPHLLWKITEGLKGVIWTVAEQLIMFADVIDRFLIYVPAVSVKKPHINFLQPESTVYYAQVHRDMTLENELRSPSELFYPILSRMAITSPRPKFLEATSGKLQVLKNFLFRLKEKSHRVVIFTQMVEMLDVLESFMRKLDLCYLRLDGSAPAENKDRTIHCFNTIHSIFGLLMSTRTGNFIRKITGANTVIFYDIDWNPTINTLTRTLCSNIEPYENIVNVYRFISEATIEKNILQKFNKEYLLKKLIIKDLKNLENICFENDSIDSLLNVESDHALQNSSKVFVQSVEENEDKFGRIGCGNWELRLFEQALAEVEEEADVEAARLVETEAERQEFEFLFDEIPIKNEAIYQKTDTESPIVSVKVTPVENYAMRLLTQLIDNWPVIANKSSENVNMEFRKKNWELDHLEKELLEDRMKSELKGFEIEHDEEPDPLFSMSIYENLICAPSFDNNDLYVDPCLGHIYSLERTREGLTPLNPAREKIVVGDDGYMFLGIDNNYQGSLDCSEHDSYEELFGKMICDEPAANVMKYPPVDLWGEPRSLSFMLHSRRKVQQRRQVKEELPPPVKHRSYSANCLPKGMVKRAPWKPEMTSKGCFGKGGK